MIGDDLASFASLVARVEDAGPGAMKVLGPLGIRPSQYAKILASFRGRANEDPALRAAFEGALAAARRGELRAPTTLSPSAAPAPLQQQASYQLMGAAAPKPPVQPPAAARSRLAGTSIALDVPRKAALPFQKTEPQAPVIVASTVALTLEQHASLTAEIAARPGLAMTTLARYGLTPDAKRTLDEHYRAAKANSEVQAAWERAYRGYWEWLGAVGWKD